MRTGEAAPAELRRGFRRARAGSTALLLALFTIGFFQRFAPATFAEPISAAFGVSAAQLGLFAAGNFWVYTVMQVPAGLLIDRYGTRLVVAVGGAVTSAGTLLLAWAPGFGLAAVGPLLVGLGTSGIFVGLLKSNATWFPERHYGVVTGITMFVGNLGSIVAEGPSAVLLTVFTWRSIFLVVGLLAAATTVLVLVVVRDSPEAAGYPDVLPRPAAPAEAEPANGRHRLRSALASRQVWLVFFAVIGTNGTFYAFSGLWGVPVLTDSFGLSNAAASAYTTIGLVVYGCGNILLGLLSDRLGRRRPVILVCSASAVAGWAGFAFLPWSPGWSAVVLYALVGLAGAQVVPAFAAVKESTAPSAAATALGVVNVGAFLASGVIQPVFGWILDARPGSTAGLSHPVLADYRWALLVPLALSVAGACCALAVRETFRRGPDH